MTNMIYYNFKTPYDEGTQSEGIMLRASADEICKYKRIMAEIEVCTQRFEEMYKAEDKATDDAPFNDFSIELTKEEEDLMMRMFDLGQEGSDLLADIMYREAKR